jgi:glycerol-3-phosphate dehydrogenase
MNIFERSYLVKQLEDTSNWDVIVIGGGASGLGIALDSISRGYSTLLLEQSDYAKGTSSRSTKLVHGGVRYLAQGNIGLVVEALYERGLLKKNASHLFQSQPFIIPVYSVWDKFFYAFGLKIYEFLSGKLSLGSSKLINKKKALSRLETIKPDNLKGGIVYCDGQFDDSRLAINLAQSCIEKGAVLLNYFPVKNILKDKNDKINGITGIDSETGKEFSINGKVVINATGVFTDDILKMDNPEADRTIRPSQGVHLILDKSFLPGNDAIMIPKTDDGRVLFIVPWQNKLVVGTTDTLIEDRKLEPVALEQEIEFILSTANRYLNKTVNRNDVQSVFAGLRPLAASKGDSQNTKEISRGHKIIITESGLISIIGGKWTTFRRMAQDVIDKVIATGKLTPKKCVTKLLAIHGAANVEKHNEHLDVYGSDSKEIKEIIENNPELGIKLHPRLEYTKAEVVWAVQKEMARTVEDVLARRVRALFTDARAAVEIAPLVAEILAIELNKDKDWKDNQVKEFESMSEKYIL